MPFPSRPHCRPGTRQLCYSIHVPMAGKQTGKPSENKSITHSCYSQPWRGHHAEVGRPCTSFNAITCPARPKRNAGRLVCVTVMSSVPKQKKNVPNTSSQTKHVAKTTTTTTSVYHHHHQAPQQAPTSPQTHLPHHPPPPKPTPESSPPAPPAHTSRQSCPPPPPSAR